MRIILALATLAASASALSAADEYRGDFKVNKTTLKSQGRNSYFVLEPGYQLVLEGKEDNANVRLVIDVLDKTKTIDRVETRIVREHESHDGKVVEISTNYFAIDPSSKDIYYFGEDVDLYKDGKVSGHKGAWHSGSGSATFGLAMPGRAKLGDRYYQEQAKSVAMDRAHHVSLAGELRTKASAFRKCLKVEETTPMEPGTREYKMYAPGVGLVQDGTLKLVKYGFVKHK